MPKKNARGGANRKPWPKVDDSIILKIFEENIGDIMNAEDYESISLPMASFGPGIVKKSKLIRAILLACPCGGVPAGAAKKAIEKIVTVKPELNTSLWNTSVFAGQRLERILVLLAHVRRLAQEGFRLQQCALKCTGPEVATIKELVKLIDVEWSKQHDTATMYYDPLLQDGDPMASRDLKREVSVDEDGYPKLLSNPSSGSHSYKDRADPTTPSPTKKARTLSRQISVDSDGFPTMLSSPGSRKKKSDATSDRGTPAKPGPTSNPIPIPPPQKQSLKEKLGYGERPVQAKSVSKVKPASAVDNTKQYAVKVNSFIVGKFTDQCQSQSAAHCAACMLSQCVMIFHINHLQLVSPGHVHSLSIVATPKIQNLYSPSIK